LAGHLANGDKNPEVVKEDKDDDTMDLSATDYQLNEALILLKGINILSAKSKQPKG
jgi:hypothetical protein